MHSMQFWSIFCRHTQASRCETWISKKEWKYVKENITIFYYNHDINLKKGIKFQ